MKNFNLDENNFSLSIKVEENLLNDNLINRFFDLKPKTEFHITILGGQNRKLLKNIKDKENTKKKLFSILEKYNFDYVLSDYFLLEKGDLKSIVVLVEIKDFTNFFEDLEKEFNCNFVLPTAHITLFISNSMVNGENFRGFSVDDWNDLKKIKIV